MKAVLNKFYTIKKGDTINSIANLYNVNPFKVLIYNNISPMTLKEGNVLFIPTSS